MLVADKFETGFDQQLVAMYVDKKIANHVEIVQTFSRLNRTAPGKDEGLYHRLCERPGERASGATTYDKGAHIDEVQDTQCGLRDPRRLDEHGLLRREGLGCV